MDSLSEATLANWDYVSERYQLEGMELARATRMSLTVRHVLNSRTPEERRHEAQSCTGHSIDGVARESAGASA